MLSIYCDGSSHAKGGLPGGWAYVIVREDQPLLADCGAHPYTTNNIMELTAAVQGLKAVLARGWTEESVEVVSDSQYTLGIASGGYTPSKNIELATELRELAIRAGARCRWVRGHTGDVWNERCDGLAHEAKQTLVPDKVKKKQARKKAQKELRNAIRESIADDTESAPGACPDSPGLGLARVRLDGDEAA